MTRIFICCAALAIWAGATSVTTAQSGSRDAFSAPGNRAIPSPVTGSPGCSDCYGGGGGAFNGSYGGGSYGGGNAYGNGYGYGNGGSFQGYGNGGVYGNGNGNVYGNGSGNRNGYGNGGSFQGYGDGGVYGNGAGGAYPNGGAYGAGGAYGNGGVYGNGTAPRGVFQGNGGVGGIGGVGGVGGQGSGVVGQGQTTGRAVQGNGTLNGGGGGTLNGGVTNGRAINGGINGGGVVNGGVNGGIVNGGVNGGGVNGGIVNGGVNGNGAVQGFSGPTYGNTYQSVIGGGPGYVGDALYGGGYPGFQNTGVGGFSNVGPTVGGFGPNVGVGPAVGFGGPVVGFGGPVGAAPVFAGGPAFVAAPAIANAPVFVPGQAVGNIASAASRNVFFGLNALVFDRDFEDDVFITRNNVDEQLLSTDANTGNFGGVEFFLGSRGSDGRGFEGRYWGLFVDESSKTLSGGPFGTYITDLHNVIWPTTGMDLETLFNAADSHTVTRDNEIHNVEFNRLRRVGSFNGRANGTYELLHGVRWFEFNEEFDWDVISSIAPTSIFYDTETRNSLVGYQIGGRSEFFVGNRMRFNVGTKTGIYNNRVRVDQQITSDTGIFAQVNGEDFNFRDAKNDIAFIGELNLGTSFHMTQRSRLNLGYRVIGVSGLALAPNQLNNFNFVPAIRNIQSNGSLLLHGAVFGLEFCR